MGKPWQVRVLVIDSAILHEVAALMWTSYLKTAAEAALTWPNKSKARLPYESLIMHGRQKALCDAREVCAAGRSTLCNCEISYPMHMSR